MKKVFLSIIAIILISFNSFGQKQVTSKTHIKFFSSTPAEDIEANNYATVGTFDTDNGELVFSVPMQSFEFEKALMQEHFNSKKFLDTKTNPKAKLKGKVTNIADLDFSKDGSYAANIEGEMTINGVSKPISENVTITVSSGKISLDSKFNITLADYEVAFKKGKPSTNIAKTVEVTVVANF